MQPSDMDKKREAFLEHLKQKYPHHASAIMGHQERLREQVSGSPKHGPSPQPGVGDQVDHLSLASLESLDAMSETDAPTAFTRGSRVRASLPVVRSTNQTKDRSLGVLYLQYNDETKQIRMPNEITSIDTIRALFVSAFPQHLNMKMLESPNVAIYVKEDMRNVYYELADVRNITDHSCLKVYHKDSAQFSHGPRPPNGDARMHSEMAHVTRDGQHPLRHPPMGPPSHHPLQGALPPTPHSMPPSPSRIPFGPRQNSVPGSATIPRDRMSNSFRKEEVAGAKPRNSMGSPVVPDPQGHPQGPTPAPNDQETRLKALPEIMKMFITYSFLFFFFAPAVGSTTLAPKTNSAPPDKNLSPLKVNLMQFRKNVSDLRIQLHQMRQLQVQNQEVLRVQLKRAEQEISIKLTEAMRRAEDPVQRQRALVEEDRHKYLGLEERVLVQLSELEQYVASLQPDSATTTRVVTLKDVEEGAVTLRKVGESLAGLKGEFPALQTRMRAVLRVEVEAVKFLKEEPHKLDSMLKRVKSLTDTLSSLRRYATEGSQKGIDISTNASVGVNHKPAAETAVEAPSTSVQLTSSSAPPEAQSSTVRSEVMPSSPVVIHHVRSSPVHMQQSQQSAALIAQPSPPLTPSPTQIPSPNLSKPQDRDSPKGSVSDPPSPARLKKIHGNLVNNGNSAPHQDLVIEELQNTKEKSKNRVMSIEAAEKEWEEKRQNMGQYDGKEFEKILQEAQANMMKGIPSLESPSEESLVDKPSKKGSDKLPKPLLEKSIKPASSKTAIKSAATDNLTRQGSDKSNKSPPPPPPRKTFSSSNSGMTTTRSGEVVYTRKESISAQPTKATPETKPKPITPPPDTASVNREEEDEGDKIMAELQVFQKCTVKDLGIKNLVEPTNRIEPQIKELRPGNLLPHKEKKVTHVPPCSCPTNRLPPPAV
uniref:Actin interacting protein 3-like C-terminal domain-containing protein n=1 Tax=Poecilia mexicana TaxID=48701 RepID=A0A3B3YNU7_9TELE